jgi:uncharacterized protein YegP (UPF0339 family)
LIALAGTTALIWAQTTSPLHAQDKDRLKFEVYQDSAKEFRWRLKAGNGETLATAGQGYKAKADCMNGVDRLKTEADKLSFEVYENNAKESH